MYACMYVYMLLFTYAYTHLWNILPFQAVLIQRTSKIEIWHHKLKPQTDNLRPGL